MEIASVHWHRPFRTFLRKVQGLKFSQHTVINATKVDMAIGTACNSHRIREKHRDKYTITSGSAKKGSLFRPPKPHGH
jgi:1,2-phenylacetyl-CoA epoxidase PaaB subunit